MKILICSAITALALPVMAGTAYAQGCSSVYVGATDYDQSRPLTLDAAIARAANASPEVLTAALEAKASSADADQASR